MMSSFETSSPVSASTFTYLMRWPVFLLIWLKLIFSESDVAGYKATGHVTRERRKSLPLDAIRRPRDTPIWKLEASLKCRSCRKGRYAPTVHMIKLTETREITSYKWVHPDE